MAFEEGFNVLLLSLGNIVRELRYERELTQIDLATKTGISQTVISRIERGEVNSFKHLCNICDCMNLEIEINFLER